MKKNFIFTSAAAALLAATAIGTGAAEFAKTNTYTPGQFTDVPADRWYASSVASAYELGFMKGSSDTAFSPEGNMTVAEAITIAARVNDAYSGAGTAFDQSTGSNWYDCYVKYAAENGIITADQFDSYTRNITRWEMAVVFSKAVPADFLNAQNNVTEIPDIPDTNAYFDEVLSLYKAGVVMGNDEYGTFKPNNNIIRAEAAAIIGRIALPENRLKKELVDANYNDAYYLISEAGRGISSGQIYNESPWNYDNRGRFAAVSNAAEQITDNSVDHKVELWRDVEDVTEGIVGWDFIGSLSAAEDGKYFKLTDDELNEVVSLTTKNGNFFFNGVDTGVAVKSSAFYFTIKADLDANKGSLYIDGAKVVEGADIGDYTVSRVYMGSDEQSSGIIRTTRTDIYKDYLVNEIFAQPEATPLCQWNVTGEAETYKTLGQNYGDYMSAMLKDTATATKSFNKISGSVVFEALMLFPEAADTGYLALTSAGVPVAQMKLNADGVFKADGTKLRFHNNNIWQTLRIEADTTTGLVTYKINGKVVAENAAMDSYANFVDGIAFGASSGTVYFDDVKVYLTHEYDDYVPTPVPVTDDGYDVILNMCSLWREGYHSNWGAISAYPDIEPALGYYDEGIVEVADWEIKFMVENGIDVQHLCWYCGQNDITVPMKKTNHNNALHEGFFNAKYSDMMKFTFMWENSGVNCKNLEQFKEYIWKYWMDYYFLDDRFYTIDNKIVITVWSYTNFLAAFGNTAEGCLEAIEWMNEDAKANGFDGVMIFFADGHNTQSAAFKKMAEIGGTASYAYHWQQDGIYADKTITRLQKNQDYKEIHIVPTVSVGFNNVGWSGERKDLATLEDHKKVLEYIKDDYLPKAEEGWKQNTLIVSTWNEYGEGTYIMPTPGLHGFGYLENIAEVISGDSSHANNIYPTEQQKARLGHLYPDSKTAMRRLDYEADEAESMVPKKVIASFTGEDFEIQMNTESIEYVDGVAVGTTTKSDPAFRIKQAAVDAKGEINMDEVVAIKIVCSGTGDGDGIYFSSKEDTSIAQKKFYTLPMKASDELGEYIIYTKDNANWTGTFNNFRLDIIKGAGTYKVKSIEFLGYSEEQMPYSIKVDTKNYSPYLSPVERNDDVYVITEAYEGFFSLHNYYYEWSRKTGVLKIVSKNDTEVIMTVGSDVALVNGKEEKLAEPLATRDGLPDVPLFWLYKATDTTYIVEGRTIEAFTADDKYIDILRARKPGEWEFEIPGDSEGFSAADGTLEVADGLFKGEAIVRENNDTQSYDARYTVSNLTLDTKKYNKVNIKMKANVEEDTAIALYFITTNESNWNQKKCVEFPVKASDNGKFVEYELRMGENTLWNGSVTAFRLDPIGRAGSYEIDYMRTVYDSSIRYDNGLPMAEELKNGDAESTDVAFYGSAAVKISIVKDEEKASNVYLVDAQHEKAWLYARQNVNWEAGAKYEVTADVKFTKTFSGKTDAKSQLMCNSIYADAEGKKDHPQQVIELKPDDGWKSVKFTVQIPANIKNGDNGQFSFYTNPAGEESMSYMFDNVVITKIS